MKKILFILLALFSFIDINAEEINGIYVWVNGSSTCYKLESTPKVTFGNNTATLTLNGQSTPVLTLQLEDNSDLKITFGVYKESTDIDAVKAELMPVKKVGKYITGGKLIIIKDGKMYDSKGVELK